MLISKITSFFIFLTFSKSIVHFSLFSIIGGLELTYTFFHLGRKNQLYLVVKGKNNRAMFTKILTSSFIYLIQ